MSNPKSSRPRRSYQQGLDEGKRRAWYDVPDWLRVMGHEDAAKTVERMLKRNQGPRLRVIAGGQ